MQVKTSEWWLRPFPGCWMTTPSLVVACSGLKPLGLQVRRKMERTRGCLKRCQGMESWRVWADSDPESELCPLLGGTWAQRHTGFQAGQEVMVTSG